MFWICSATRHYLLQSNAYDLGLFDQWIWLVSKGLPPISSMEGVHILADHGALSLYLAAIPYSWHHTLQWLLASQALCLSLTAIPIWLIAEEAGLNKKLCWLCCGLWWLQPVVFNTNLFDFHPEVWAMPALAGCYLMRRKEKPLLWFALLVFLLSCRDGLVLIVIGIGLDETLKKKWRWALGCFSLAFTWLVALTYILYPSLTGNTNGPKAVKTLFSYLGDNLFEIFINIILKPQLILNQIDFFGGVEYLILLVIGLFPFWSKKSIPTLTGSLPLIVINLLSEASPQRSLVHHYSLPIAVVAVVACIDGLSSNPNQTLPWKKLCWNAICWASLAKPWFFTGPYLARIESISNTNEAISYIPKTSSVLTTSYLIPHLSQRVEINFPKENNNKTIIENYDAILLNPQDPGWGSNNNIQEELLQTAKKANWKCKSWETGLELCINRSPN